MCSCISTVKVVKLGATKLYSGGAGRVVGGRSRHSWRGRDHTCTYLVVCVSIASCKTTTDYQELN